MPQSVANRWVLLIHQIPPKPDYFRIKVGRRLQRLGAVAIKNSVYVLPRSDETVEDFQWQMREIVAGGGEASVCERSEEHTSELQSRLHLVCRLLLEKKKKK